MKRPGDIVASLSARPFVMIVISNHPNPTVGQIVLTRGGRVYTTLVPESMKCPYQHSLTAQCAILDLSQEISCLGCTASPCLSNTRMVTGDRCTRMESSWDSGA